MVNDPALAAVPPIAGGEAKYVENPVPETVDDADKVVKAPVDGVVAPTAILFSPVDNILPILDPATENPIPGLAQYSPVPVSPVNA